MRVEKIVAALISAGMLSAGLLTAAESPVSAQAPPELLLLREVRLASGGDAWDRLPGLTLTGRRTSLGMSGSWQITIDARTGRRHETADMDLFRLREVWDGSTLWRSGSSGGVHPINSPFARQLNVTDAWIARRGYYDPASADLTLVGTRDVDGARADVLEARPRDGAPVELWFDSQSHLLVRTVQQLPISTRTVRYGDYRKVHDTMVPFELVTDQGNAANAETIAVESVTASPVTDQQFRRPDDPRDFTVSGGKTVVPLGLDGFVTVDAVLNGHSPMTFILDTGGHAILTPDAARALGLKTQGAARIGGAGEGTLGAQFATVDSLAIGGLLMNRVFFSVVPLGFDTIERGAKPPFAGILGLELFERLAVSIDYRERRLELQPLSSYTHQGGGRMVPIYFEDDMPCFDAVIEKRHGELAIDTGFPESLAVVSRWAERNDLLPRFRGLAIVATGAVGGAFTLHASRAELQIGELRAPATVAFLAENQGGALSSRTQAGLVGNAVFAGARVEFDYRNGQLWIDGPTELPPTPFDRSGIMIGKERVEAFVVGSVIPGSPAAEAGIVAGDQITMVDQTPAAGLSGFEFMRSMKRPAGTRVALRVEQQGNERTVTLDLRELLP